MKITASKTALAAAFLFACVGFTTAQTVTQTPATPDASQRPERGGRGFKGQRGGGGRHHGRDGAHGFGRYAAQLNLTEAQRTSLREIVERGRARTQAQRDEMRSLFTRGTEPTDAQKTRFKELRQALRASSESAQNEMLAVLTAEQRTQWETLKVQAAAHREERKQRRAARTPAAPAATPGVQQ